MQPHPIIRIRGARTHNLKNVNVDLKRESLVVITGVSGSGKSSLVFDTLYAEGQRRYVESISVNSRQFLPLLPKPDVDLIDGLSPSIAIEQKSSINNPRSIVGTVTDIYDHLRVLFARAGTPFCPNHPKIKLEKYSASQINDELMNNFLGSKLEMYARIIDKKSINFENIFDDLRAKGFVRLRIKTNDTPFKLYDIDQIVKPEKGQKYTIDVLVDRLIIKKEHQQRISESIESCFQLGNGRLITVTSPTVKVNSKNNSCKTMTFSAGMNCSECNFTMDELEPSSFSFNKPQGACLTCKGLGQMEIFDPEKIVQYVSGSLSSGAIPGWDQRNQYNFAILEGLAEKYNFSLKTPFEELSDSVKKLLLYGETLETKNSFKGIIDAYENSWAKETPQEVKNKLIKFRSLKPCKACKGNRLNQVGLSVKIKCRNDFLNIFEIVNMSIPEAKTHLEQIVIPNSKKTVISCLLEEIINRINFLVEIGLGYLSLSRNSSTLSGGELQRIRLATQIGARLSGVMYVLDEPSRGLHQRDNKRLIDALIKLRNLGNTVIVVEHDEETMRVADQIIDVGPGAGQLGGSILCSGDFFKIIKAKNSYTADYLNGSRKIKIPNVRKVPENRWFKLYGAHGNNLKNIDFKMPISRFVCITGVSGSGKSSLINGVISKAIKLSKNKTFADDQASLSSNLNYSSVEGLEYFENLISVNQKPIGKTPRSNPATYLGLFNYIREIFASCKMSKERGYSLSRFSFNLKGGRCEFCQGDGSTRIEMHFLPDVFVKCDVCNGKRFSRETLEIRWRGKNIFEVLSMTVEEAHKFFFSSSLIEKKLKTLIDVGLHYIRLGQSSTTFSGGEAQRIKLANELSKRNTGSTLYILDEPTTGLHFHDIAILLKALFKLRDSGNSILVIEHNLDVIKTADWVIDMGPEGGNDGGKIIAEGPPEEIAKNNKSYTGHYLKKIL